MCVRLASPWAGWARLEIHLKICSMTPCPCDDQLWSMCGPLVGWPSNVSSSINIWLGETKSRPREDTLLPQTPLAMCRVLLDFQADDSNQFNGRGSVIVDFTRWCCLGQQRGSDNVVHKSLHLVVVVEKSSLLATWYYIWRRSCSLVTFVF